MPAFLPLELVHKVIQDVDDQPTLAACCRVARPFLDESRRRLYGQIDIKLPEGDDVDTYHWDDASLDLVRMLLRCPTIADLVQAVALVETVELAGKTRRGISTSAQKALCDVLAACSGVHTVTLPAGSINFAACAGLSAAADERESAGREPHDLRTLELQFPNFLTEEMLEHYPRVEHLRFSSPGGLDDADGGFDPNLPTLSDLRLSSLVLRQLDPASAPHFVRNLTRSSLDTLTRLENEIDALVSALPTCTAVRTLRLATLFEFEEEDECVEALCTTIPASFPRSLVALSVLFNDGSESDCHLSYSLYTLRALLSAPSPARLRSFTYDRRPYELEAATTVHGAEKRKELDKFEEECREKGLLCRGLRSGQEWWE
ncbi:hypothetical protein JCM8097_002220 [Rhodosporidiobolus ruineniae]